MDTVEELRRRVEVAERRLAEEQAERARILAELQLSQRLEAVGQLAAGVAHEINTPTQYCMDNTRFFEESFADLVSVLQAYETLAAAVAARDDVAGPLATVAEARQAADLEFLLGSRRARTRCCSTPTATACPTASSRAWALPRAATPIWACSWPTATQAPARPTRSSPTPTATV